MRTKEHNEHVVEAIARDPSLRDMVQFTEVDDGFLALGPRASNNDLKGFSCPCSAIDTVYYNDGGGDTLFVEDLRLAFATAGIRFIFFGPPHMVARTPKPRRQELLDTLVPRLTPI
jgi:hypothetical protein